MECKACGCTHMYIQKTNTHTGLYCANVACNKWQTWVGNKKINDYRHLPLYNIGESPRMVEAYVNDYGVKAYRQYNSNNTSGFNLQEEPSSGDSEDLGVSLVHHINSEYYPREGEMSPTNLSAVPVQEHIDYASTYMQPNGGVVATQPKSVAPDYNSMCVACVSGVVPSLEESNMFTLQYKKSGGLLLFLSKVDNRVLYTSKVSFCPVCGKPNGH